MKYFVLLCIIFVNMVIADEKLSNNILQKHWANSHHSLVPTVLSGQPNKPSLSKIQFFLINRIKSSLQLYKNLSNLFFYKLQL